jgi:hypothetical protein
VVATSRNDDHGGGMLRRMQIFVSGWIAQCRRHGLAAELLLVEWNPPGERAPLAEALEWPEDSGPCAVRIVTVPEALHRRLRHADALPLFQMIAKNVGIRRARAPFVLATNVDILFDDELVACLAARRLERGSFYRIDRSDAMSDVPLEAGVVEQLEYCRTHLLRVNQREATFPAQGGPPLGASGDSLQGFRPGAGLGLDRRPTGEAYLSGCGEGTLIVTPPAAGTRVLRMVVEVGPQLSREPLTFQVRDREGRVLARVSFRSPQRLFVPLPQAGGEELELRLGVEQSEGRLARPASLQFRLFEWGWASRDELRFDCGLAEGTAPQPRAVDAGDVYQYVQGISLHEGWGEREFTPDGRLYRQARDGASFSAYRATRMPGRLVLDLEAAFGSVRELRLAAQDSSRVVARRRFEGREPVRVSIPDAGPVGRTAYTIQLDEEGERAAEPGCGVRVRALRRVGPGQALRSALSPLAKPRVDYLHTNACGDFTLMHREHWQYLRGYPEWAAYSMNIDGFTCFAAHAAGLREVVLREPMRIYHIEHGLGSGWSPEGEKKLYDRITSRGITWISKEQVLELARRMYAEGPIISNDEDWGLARERLPEASPLGRRAPAVAAPTPVPSAASED